MEKCYYGCNFRDVNKDSDLKAKDWRFKAKARTKDSSLRAKVRTKDSSFVLKYNQGQHLCQFESDMMWLRPQSNWFCASHFLTK